MVYQVRRLSQGYSNRVESSYYKASNELQVFWFLVQKSIPVSTNPVREFSAVTTLYVRFQEALSVCPVTIGTVSTMGCNL